MAGKVEKLGHNRYRVRFVDKMGKRRCRTIYGTRAEAMRVKADIERGISGVVASSTFAGYWDSVVLPSLDGLAAKTREEYVRLWEHDLEPSIGGMPISDIGWEDVQKAMDGIDAPTVQRHAFALLRKICNMAIRDRLLLSNPCDRSIRFKKHKKREKVLVEASDVVTLMEKIEGIKYEPVILCLLGGGLRPEEADALRWEDIQPFEMNGRVYAAVSVSKTIVMTRDGALEQNGTKTALSERTVLIGEPFASRLLELKRDGVIVPGRDGKPTSPMSITHNWKQWCGRNGVPYVSQENMRSSWATMQGEAGSPDSICSLAMGHADGTTKGINYQQATLRGLAMIADNLADYIQSANYSY